LKILDQSLEALLHSTGAFTWPRGEHHQLFRAQVVNLDLDEPLVATTQDGQLMFPSLALIRKVATLHAASPYVAWTLCLTLHGEVAWSDESDKLACSFLAENFARDQQFAVNARRVLGDTLFEVLTEKPRGARLRRRSRGDQRKALAVLVPKRIAFETHPLGWRVETVENLEYGGGAHAAMATWIMRFEWDSRAGAQPDTVYRESLGSSLRRTGHIDAGGELHRRQS
jgi:hypothetical protein